MMEASSSKIFLTMDVHHSGHFTRNPLAYVKGKKLTLHNIEVSCFKFEDLFEFVRTTTDTMVTEIYYNRPKKSLAKGISILRCDDDLKEFVKFGNENDGRISLYVCHKNEDLSSYTDGGIDNEEEEKCGLDDMDNEHSDDDSDVASVDHLSEGEQELMQVRLKKAKCKISKKSLDDYDFDFNVPLESENEEEAGKEFNPMFSNVESEKGGKYVEPDVESDRDMPMRDSDDEMSDTEKWIIHDPNTHWKLQKPTLGERYESFDQLKDCLIYYSVANGYQLWYEKSDSKKLLVKCGLDQKKKKGETHNGTNKPRCSFRMRAVKMRGEQTVHIRSLHDTHTCTRQYYLGSLVTSKWIASPRNQGGTGPRKKGGAEPSNQGGTDPTKKGGAEPSCVNEQQFNEEPTIREEPVASPSNKGNEKYAEPSYAKPTIHEELTDVEVLFEDVEVAQILDADPIHCELIEVEVINEEQSDEDDGVDVQDDEMDVQADEVDVQANEVERVRTRRVSQRLVLRNWNKKPMPIVNGEGTTPEKAFLVL